MTRPRHRSSSSSSPSATRPTAALRTLVAIATTGIAAATACGTPVEGDASAQPAINLDELLLSPDEISDAMNTASMTPHPAETGTQLGDDSPYTRPAACAAVGDVAQLAAYADSGWTDIRIQGLHGPGDTFDNLAFQAVTAFPTQQAAETFTTTSHDRWAACAQQQYSFIAGDHEVRWQVGPVTSIDGVLTATKSQLDPPTPWVCQRALTAADSVVIDIQTCSAPGEDAVVATAIARQIAEKIRAS